MHNPDALILEQLTPSFTTGFKPGAYLRDYYPPMPKYDQVPTVPKFAIGSVEENLGLLEFYARQAIPAIVRRPGKLRLLEVGGGPTVYQLISLSSVVSEIWFTDYCIQNLQAIKTWKEEGNNQWLTYIHTALCFELGRVPQVHEVIIREQEIKAKITKLSRYDILTGRLGEGPPRIEEKFDVVSSNFCIESITLSKKVWLNSLRRLSSLISPGGLLVMTALKNSVSYSVGDVMFPAVSINQEDIWYSLKAFGFNETYIAERECKGNEHYEGMLMLTARKL